MSSFCTIRSRRRLPQRPLQHRVAHQLGHRRGLPHISLRAPSIRERAQSLHPELNALCQDALPAVTKDVRLAPPCCQLDMVHLRCESRSTVFILPVTLTRST